MFEIIKRARRSLFDAGGIELCISDGVGRMKAVSEDPVLQERAAAYNLLASAHETYLFGGYFGGYFQCKPGCKIKDKIHRVPVDCCVDE